LFDAAFAQLRLLEINEGSCTERFESKLNQYAPGYPPTTGQAPLANIEKLIDQDTLKIGGQTGGDL
jgi:hypothetical protein